MRKLKQRTAADLSLLTVTARMEADDKYLDKTARQYRRYVRKLNDMNGRDTLVGEVTVGMLEEFRHWMGNPKRAGRSYTARSIQSAIDGIGSVVKYVAPDILPDRYRGNVRRIFNIRLDIADSDAARHPRRLERVLKAITDAIKAEA